MNRSDNMSARGGSAFGGKKVIIFTILIASLALSGCAVKKGVEVGKDNQNKNTENTANENKQMANPASTYCVEQGGNSVIIETEAGQAGICKFNDGSECDEWAFFRKECKQGDKTAEVAGTIDTSSTTSEVDLDISKWQIYQNKEYGFEMKYPENVKFYNNAFLTQENYNCIIEKDFNKQCLSEIAFDVKLLDGQNINEYLIENKCYSESDCMESVKNNKEKININNNYFIPFENMYGCSYYYKENDLLLGFFIGNCDKKNLGYKILSTFKFTD